jgi:regulatory protein
MIDEADPRVRVAPDDLDDNPEADPESVARAICLRQLTMGPRSRGQLAEALAQRQVPAEAASAVLDRFTDVGLIDDAAFAAGWVESRQAGRGLARRALAHELRAKGIAEPLVAEALEAVSLDDERARAQALVARKLPGTRGLAADARLRRLSGMLARKGYSSGLAFAVVREALEQEGDALPDPDLESHPSEDGLVER